MAARAPFIMQRQTTTISPRALLGLAAAISLVLGLFFGRLYQLQIAQYQEFSTRSRNNQVSLKTIRSLRGEVYARDGTTPLIQNRQVLSLVLKGGRDGITATTPLPLFWDRIQAIAKLPATLPEVRAGKEEILVPDLPREAGLALAEWLVGQDQFELRERMVRIYHGGGFGHLLGYTGLATDQDELEGYAVDDLKGVAGLEAGLESLLRGKNGVRAIEVDAFGNVISEQSQVEPVAGKRITLTIDFALQQKTQELLNESLATVNRLRVGSGKKRWQKPKGSVVVLKPKTGEVLALASAPDWDPTIFFDRSRNDERVDVLTNNDNRAMFNRATSLYEPGSTFKLVTASMVLENGWGNRYYNCSPSYTFGGRTFRNWARVGMGGMDAAGAIAQSCNTWYYQYAAQVGPVRFAAELVKRANDFGFNQKTGIELPNERIAPVFTKSRDDIVSGEGLNNSIGQGEIQSTPLQIARMLATIVNDGARPELTLVRAIDGQPVPPKPTVQLTGQHWGLLQRGMRKTVVSGTAKQVLGEGRFAVATAGKTGTAQHQRHLGDHSWYMGYGPYANPEIVVVAFLEEGIEGSGAALPLVAKVMSAYWKVPLRGK
jgi:penicillin-binding protein 2